MNILADFVLTPKQINNISRGFSAKIRSGAAGKRSCFKMLPSYLSVASGKECGSYIALDFGGTNIRADLIELKGKRRAKTLKSAIARIPLELTVSSAMANELFAFVATVVAQVVPDNNIYKLGHTFSFPVYQNSVNDGILLEWAKEFATSGMKGRRINALLHTELSKLGVGNVQPIALINDTVATLLAASYSRKYATISSICGTGHNTAFFDAQQNMIINLESGNFNLMPRNRYDEILDRQSINPSRQFLEKMASGRYLGELFRITIDRKDFIQPFMLDTQTLSNIIMGLDSRFNETECELAIAIVRRGAMLVAASYIGVLDYVDNGLERSHGIAIDGSLYEKIPLYAETIQNVLDEHFGDKGKQINVFLQNRGSVLGSAIAAAIVEMGNMDK